MLLGIVRMQIAVGGPASGPSYDHESLTVRKGMAYRILLPEPGLVTETDRGSDGRDGDILDAQEPRSALRSRLLAGFGSRRALGGCGGLACWRSHSRATSASSKGTTRSARIW